MKIEKESGKIFNIQKFSIHDGPGIRTLVFFKGCPLSCYWCANPEGISFCGSLMFDEGLCRGCKKCLICKNLVHSFDVDKNGDSGRAKHKLNREKCSLCGDCARECCYSALKLVGKQMSVDEVLDIVLQDVEFYRTSGGGVTLGGGEPTMQPEFAKKLLDKCKQSGINTVIETCAYCCAGVLEEFAEFVDDFYIDIKHIDRDKHFEGTGVYNDLILSNVIMLLESEEFDSLDFGITVRVPVIPGFNDDDENIRGIVSFLVGHNLKNRLRGIEFLSYHRFGVSKYKKLGMQFRGSNTDSVCEERLGLLKRIVKEAEINVVGG